MKTVLITTLVVLISCTIKTDPNYSIPEIPWNEKLGNHRAVMQVDNPANAVSIELFWRRHDKYPDKKQFIIIHENGDTIQNIRRIQVNNERCHLVFGPVKKGLYFFYYLPRLRWLNSSAGIDDLPVAPYNAIQVSNDGVIELSGKRLEFDRSGLPKSIEVYGNEILNNPIIFIIESANKTEILSETSNFEINKDQPGILSSSWTNSVQGFEVQSQRTIEFDGWLDTKIKVKATKDITLNDVRLEIPFQRKMSIYMMGMGLPGQLTPASHTAKWTDPYDSFWMGNVKGGLHCELRGADYTGPLLALYKPSPPASWYNDGKGGFKIRTRQEETRAIVYSGKRDLKAGEEVEFEFALIITPVKKLNPKSQFINRYFHSYPNSIPGKEDMEAKIKIINVHHANKYNPHINYPFIAVDAMRELVDHWHEQSIKVKVYYTVRELTNYATEVWALRSLGDEIFRDGDGAGCPWLREHFVNGYVPQWYDRIDSVTVDASVLTTAGEARWYNYYVEGLKWLVKDVDIDGLYLDDVAFERNMISVASWAVKPVNVKLNINGKPQDLPLMHFG